MGSSSRGSLLGSPGSACGLNTFADGGALLNRRPIMEAPIQETAMFTLLITGSSRQVDAELVWNPLFWMVNTHGQMIVSHVVARGAGGVDALVQAWCDLDGHEWNRVADPERLVVEQPFADADALVASGGSALFAFPDGRRKSRVLYTVARAWCVGIPCFVWSSSRIGVYHRLSEGEGAAVAHRMLGWGS